MDKNWYFWMVVVNPNSHKLSGHEKYMVEPLNQIIRNQDTVILELEQLHDQQVPSSRRK
jgi:hypothetical protein